ncbi:MAG: hypothetical protein WBA59_11395 [Moheibacter sp.]
METEEIQNYSGSEEPKQSGNRKSGQAIMIALAVLLLGSLGFNIYQFTQQKKSDEEIQLVNVNLKDTENARVELQRQFDDLTYDYDQTKAQLAMRDSTLSARDSEIAEKRNEIQSLLSKKNATEGELAKAQKLINSLNTDINRYKQEIAVLQAQNDSLLIANDTLHVQQERISGRLVAETSRANENERNLRSTFSISNYKITGLKVKGSGKEVETEKAKRIDKLRVSFDLDPNQYAETGEKEIYIAIFKPDGKLGKFKNATPGQLETWQSGLVDYSDKVNFNYTQGTKQNITFDWEEYDFPKGIYKIDLYQNGMKIGQKSLELK